MFLEVSHKSQDLYNAVVKMV